MSAAHHDHASLSYFQTSPVRGQLEPYEPQSRAGWRYLQCTDTPNELKVLLPPKTALLYSQLLQYEVSELERSRGADWERIVHIRHLKDRMIRKCQRLARMTHSPGTVPAAFRIVHAPADFRLKEMERWLRDQEPRGKSSKKEVRRQPSTETANTQSQTSQLAYTHAQAARSPRTPRLPASPSPAQRVASTRSPGSVRRHGSGSSRSSNYVDSRASAESLRQRPSVHHQAVPPRNPYLSPVAEEQIESVPPGNVLPNPHGDTPQRAVEESTFSSPSAPRTDVISPDPLPHLYRPPSMLAPMGGIAATMMSPPDPVAEPAPPLLGMPEPFAESFAPMAPAMPEPAPIAGPSRPLTRRRSNLRQNGGRSSANGTPKMVSWAMDRDWADHLTKFDHIVYAAEFAGDELEDARKKFQDEISGVRSVRLAITSALERLRLETDTLQAEEANLRAHEERVVASFERLKEKEANYKERVQTVVDESKRAVIAADNRRESAAVS
ncbi:hypothetical protein BC826DRAFT_1005553 [Russula brevipes]|nr:hypothetical protein BC826DRAFT_1005553 [Russula brevipes]